MVNNGVAKYIITPQKNSDYRFYISSLKGKGNRHFTITRIKNYGTCFEKEDDYPVYRSSPPTSDADGGLSLYYCLKKKETYIIRVSAAGHTKGNYNFKVEQDNWIKNNNGGVWVEENKNGRKTLRKALRQFYLTNEQLRVYDHIRREGRNKSSLFSNLIGNGGFTLGGTVEAVIAKDILPKKFAKVNSKTVTAACYLYGAYSMLQGIGDYVDEEYYLAAYERAICNNIGISYRMNPSLYGMEYYWRTWEEWNKAKKVGYINKYYHGKRGTVEAFDNADTYKLTGYSEKQLMDGIKQLINRE